MKWSTSAHLEKFPQIRYKNSHKATHGQREADPSATSRVANPASRSDAGFVGWKSQL